MGCAAIISSVSIAIRFRRNIDVGWAKLSPMEIVGKIHTDTVAALADPAIRTKLEQGGAVVSGSTPAELAAFLHSEMEKWGAVIKEANIKAQ